MNKKQKERRAKQQNQMWRRRKLRGFLEAREVFLDWRQPPKKTELLEICNREFEAMGLGKATSLKHADKLLPAWVQPKIPSKGGKKKRKDFYQDDRWRTLRYKALLLNDGRCECCGASPAAGNDVELHVDHIKPRIHYPQLQYELSNLQVLCRECNLGKSAWDQTDWREPRLRVLMGEEID